MQDRANSIGIRAVTIRSMLLHLAMSDTIEILLAIRSASTLALFSRRIKLFPNRRMQSEDVS